VKAFAIIGSPHKQFQFIHHHHHIIIEKLEDDSSQLPERGVSPASTLSHVMRNGFGPLISIEGA